MVKVVLWDSDGTLVDSFPGHAKYLKDVNERDSLGLNLPNSLDVRDWNGKIANPMENFFRVAGFPEKRIKDYVKEYESCFFENYFEMLKPFSQTREVLRLLNSNDVGSVVITSNTEENVRRSLEGELKNGLIKRIVGLETARKKGGQKSKAELIKEIIGNIGEGEEFIYVGDMEKDFWASYDAGIPFIGVSYGWGIREDTQIEREGFEYPLVIATNLRDVASVVLKTRLNVCHPKRIG